jgi:hypothetical protein
LGAGATKSITAAGTYTVTVTGTNGCTATESITITQGIATSTQSIVTAVICEGDVYNDNGFNERIAGDYSRTITGGNSAGCDSIVVLKLTVSKLPNVALETADAVCADYPDFALNVLYSGNYDVEYTNFDVTFDAKAVNAGFGDISGGTVAGGGFTVTLPRTGGALVYPDRYTGNVRLYDAVSGCEQTLPFGFDVYYPATIMEQKWDDVIALLNKHYNGGEYEYAGYQWYCNGKMLTGETSSYIYLNNASLVIGDEYYVELTRADGSKMFSCPFKAHEARPVASDYPIIIQNNGVISIHLSTPRNAVANLWTVTGILIGSVNINETVNTLAAPMKGMYILEIVNKDDASRQAVPIVVSR